MDTNNNPSPGESNVPTTSGGGNASDDVSGFSEQGIASPGESNVPTSPGESNVPTSPGESNGPS